MRLHVTHETRYDYTPAVELAHHMAYLRPLSNPWQSLHAHQLQIEPVPLQCRQDQDSYGNHRAYFSLYEPHNELVVTARSIVSTQLPRPASSRIGWEALSEQMRYRAGVSGNDATQFSFASPRAPRDPVFAAYARPSFAPGASALQAVTDLMIRIHADLRYQTLSTEVNTSALQALEQGAGVCQDFAHIMLACLRSLGLPARYVSGYLLTQPPAGQARLLGSDASHAWVSVYLPDLTPDQDRPDPLPGPSAASCWYDLDPTNARAGWGSPGPDYVTLATGRDYADVAPMRGVIHGGNQHTLHVAVTVRPEAEATAGSA